MRHNANRMSWIGSWLPPVLWAALILSLSTLPEVYFGPPPSSEGRRIHYYLEVLVHIAQFCVFFLLVIRALRRSASRREARLLGYAFVSALVLSLLNESIQTLTPTRMFDYADMAMDALGVLVGVGLVLLLDARRERSRLEGRRQRSSPPSVSRSVP
jgi:VanZ family protein